MSFEFNFQISMILTPFSPDRSSVILPWRTPDNFSCHWEICGQLRIKIFMIRTLKQTLTRKHLGFRKGNRLGL